MIDDVWSVDHAGPFSVTFPPARLLVTGRVISASDDKTLRVWELQTGQELVSLTEDAAVFCCAVLLDGRTIVAGDDGGTVHFLRIEKVPVVARITMPSPDVSGD